MKFKSPGKFSITKGRSRQKETKQEDETYIYNIFPSTRAADDRSTAASTRTGGDERDEGITPYERWERFMDVVAFPENHIPEMPKIPEMDPETKDTLQIVLNEMNPFAWNETEGASQSKKQRKQKKNTKKNLWK